MSTQPRCLILVALAAVAATACPTPQPATSCHDDSDCPANYSCDTNKLWCMPRLDAGSTDAAVADGAVADAAVADGAVADAAVTDSSVADAVRDTGPGQDASAGDVTGADSAGLVQIVELVANPPAPDWDTPAVIHFRTANATDCTIDGAPYAGAAANSASGVDHAVRLLASHTFELVCQGPGGPASQQLEVMVICSDADTVPVSGGHADIATLDALQAFAGPGRCYRIVGSLHIRGSGDIVDLSPLAGVFMVVGDLLIHDNASLTTLHGLESLQTVTGSLAIGDWYGTNNRHEGNPRLASIEALSGLREVGYGLRIDGFVDGPPMALASLHGLEELRVVGDDLIIQWQDALTSLAALRRLTRIGGTLWIESAPLLHNLHGLEQLTDFQGSLGIQYMTSLLDISALAGLTRARSITIEDAPVLQNLHGLENVTSVTHALYIMYNDILDDISALEGAFPSGTLQHVTIKENPWLADYGPLDAITAIVKESAGATCPAPGDPGYWDAHGNLVLMYGFDTPTLLPNLHTIECSLHVEQTDLTSLATLSNVSSLGGSLTVHNNGVLTTLGLSQYCQFGGPDLTVTSNPHLPTAAAQALANAWTAASPSAYHVTISGNAP